MSQIPNTQSAASELNDPTWHRDRSTRFLARVDRHLAAVPDQKSRELFLRAMLAGWEHSYSRFVSKHGPAFEVGEGTDAISAADFMLTIVGLHARLREDR